jgi:spermidine/putrescine transport system substrate-binding protein
MTQRPNPPRDGLSRRTFLAGSGLLGAGVALGGSAFLAACGGSSSDGGGASPTTATGSTGSTGGTSGSLFFENWPAYIDSETVAAFRADTGIDFKYTEAFNDNNEYFAKVQPVLSKGKSIGPDILAPTFWMASRFIGLGWAQKLPLAKIPNATNLRDDLVKPSFDPTGEFTLPWQTGMTGIAYNEKVTGRPLDSVNDLFDPAFKGKVGMLLEMRDTVGLTMLSLGLDPSSVQTFDQAKPAFDKLDTAKSDGQIRAFTGNDYLDDLSQGNFAVCTAWSGDVLQLSKDNPDVKFAIPKEGGMSWYDTMLWVTGSDAIPDDVAAWMNYVYDPAHAARITAEVQYISPVKGVRDELVKMGGDAAALADSPLLFPDAATLDRLHTFANLGEDEEAKFDEAFSAITGA